MEYRITGGNWTEITGSTVAPLAPGTYEVRYAATEAEFVSEIQKVVIAKGEGHLAARIKEVGRENKVEIVENKPLARTLYANVEIGEVIPPELYQAVADVLAFVYKLQGKI